MTRKDALAELIAMVEAGETLYAWLILAALDGIASNNTPIVQPVRWICDPEDIRGMGAAKALHEAVLPDQSIRIEQRVGGWVVWLDKPHKGISDNPARAWFLAILRALHAREGGGT
jgi:hypothetical protein